MTLERAQWLEDGGLLESDSGSKARIDVDSGGMGLFFGSFRWKKIRWLILEDFERFWCWEFVFCVLILFC